MKYRETDRSRQGGRKRQADHQTDRKKRSGDEGEGERKEQCERQEQTETNKEGDETDKQAIILTDKVRGRKGGTERRTVEETGAERDR